MRLRIVAFVLTLAAAAHADEGDAQELKAHGHQAMMDMNYGDALDFYRRALEKNPSDVSLRYNIGRAHQAREEYPQALDALLEFSKSAPPDVRAKVPKLDTLIADIRARVAVVTLTCSAEVPDGVVVFGDRLRVTGCGTTPKTLRTSVPTKRAEIDVILESSSWQAQTAKAVLEGGDSPVSVALTVAPKATTGMLRVRAAPFAAKIAIDGVEKGNPVDAFVSAGSHVVDVRADRHEPAHVPVIVEAGGRRELTLELEKTPPLTSRWWFWTGVGIIVAGAGVLTWYLVAQPERDADRGSIDPGRVSAPLRF